MRQGRVSSPRQGRAKERRRLFRLALEDAAETAEAAEAAEVRRPLRLDRPRAKAVQAPCKRPCKDKCSSLPHLVFEGPRQTLEVLHEMGRLERRREEEKGDSEVGRDTATGEGTEKLGRDTRREGERAGEARLFTRTEFPPPPLLRTRV